MTQQVLTNAVDVGSNPAHAADFLAAIRGKAYQRRADGRGFPKANALLNPEITYWWNV